MFASAALAGCLVLAAPPAAARAGADLSEGIARFRAFDEEAAAALLKRSLAEHPTPEQAGRAHVYLGLLAVNDLELDEARRHFQQALAANPFVELPTDASPKAKLLLVQVRRNLMAQSGPPAPAEPPPPAAPSVLVLSPEPTPAPPATAATATPPREGHHGGLRWSAWTTAAIAVAALGTGAGFGFAQSQAQTALNASTDAGQAARLAQEFDRDGLIADILLAAGGAVAVASVVLFAVPVRGDDDASASLSLSPGEVRASVDW